MGNEMSSSLNTGQYLQTWWAVFEQLKLIKVLINSFQTNALFSISMPSELQPGSPQTSKMESYATIAAVKDCSKVLYLRCLQGFWPRFWLEHSATNMEKHWNKKKAHCPKSALMWRFFWSVFSRICTEYEKIRTIKNSVSGHLSLALISNTLTPLVFILNRFVQAVINKINALQLFNVNSEQLKLILNRLEIYYEIWTK